MRRFVLLAVFVGLLFVGDSLAPAQPCGPQGCPIGSPAVIQPEVPQRHQYPALVTTHFIQGRKSSIASGAIVSAGEGMAQVLTCAHAYEPSSSVLVITQDGRRWPAEIRGIDREQDVALLSIQDPGIKPLQVAEDEPQAGESVYVAGFAGGRTPAGSWGRVTQWVSPGAGRNTFMEVSSPAVNGMSGGPILNNRGQVVGLITGTSGRTCIGPCLPRVRAVLRFLLPPYGRTPAPLVPVQLAPKTPRVNPPAAPGPSPIIAGPTPSEEIAKLQEAHAVLSAEVAALNARVAILEKTGPVAGPPGPPGPAGPSVDVSKLAAAVASAVTLPPLRIQTLKVDGSVHQEVAARLGDLVKLKPIPVQAEGK